MTELDLSQGIYRRVYAGFIWGKRINSVSLEAEAWFWRIQAIADDFGNLPGDAHRVHHDTHGWRHASVQQVGAWVSELIANNLLSTYTVGGENFLHITGFGKLQPAGAKNGRRVRRFPESPYDRNETEKDTNSGGGGESGGIRVNPGEERKTAPPQYQDQYQHQHHHQGQSQPVSAVGSELTAEQQAVFDYLTLCLVGRVKCLQFALGGLTLSEARKINDARTQAGKPPDGKFVSQLQAGMLACKEREKRRQALQVTTNGMVTRKQGAGKETKA